MRESDLGNQISTDKPQIKRGKPYFRLFQLTYKVPLRAAAKTRSSCDRNRTISLMSQLMALDGVKIAILDGKLGSCESLFLFQKKNKHTTILGWYSFVRGLCNEPNDISSRLVICLFSWRFWGTFCGEHKNHPTGNKCWSQTFPGIWCCRVIKGICMVIKFLQKLGVLKS